MSSRQQQWSDKTKCRQVMDCVNQFLWDGLRDGKLDMSVVCKRVRRGREITIVHNKRVLSFVVADQEMEILSHPTRDD